MSNIQIVHQLLSQVGIKFDKRCVRENGKGRWGYRLHQEHWQKLAAILHGRSERRQRLAMAEAESDHPLGLTSTVWGGDQAFSSVRMNVSSPETQFSSNDLDLEARREWESDDDAGS